jgi:DNA repair protein RadC
MEGFGRYARERRAPPMTNERNSAVNLPSPFESPRIRLVSTKLTVREPRVSYAVSTSAEAAKLLHRLIGACDREHFVALYLDARHKVTHAHVVSIGTMLSSIVHPREVFKAALLANAAAIIVGHNHPSGDVTPSSEDHVVAERLQDAGALLGIELLDALVVGPGKRFYAKVTGLVQDLS